jgi:hypothetical protein
MDYTTYMGNLDRRVCNDCRDDHYVQCSRCGDWMHSQDAHYDNDDDPYCDDCYEELKLFWDGKATEAVTYEDECPRCGALMQRGAFCSECGKELRGGAE